MKAAKVERVDQYRDGGSLELTFLDEAGVKHRMMMRVKGLGRPVEFHAPVIYTDHGPERRSMDMTWEEADQFLSDLPGPGAFQWQITGLQQMKDIVAASWEAKAKRPIPK